MSAIQYTGDLVVSLPSSDLTRTRQWYEQHLNFTHLFTADKIGWMEMDTHIKGVTMGFGQNRSPKPGNAVPVFDVNDLESARRTLENNEVTFDGDTIVIPGMVKLATLYDPDDNALMLSQDLSQK